MRRCSRRSGPNGDIFHPDAGKLVPTKAVFAWNAHIHSPGIPGADREAVLNIGLKFHLQGYKPKFQEGDLRSDLDNQRYDAYWVAPQPFKLLNFEPHLHATGVRMCMEAIYQRSIETLSCAGYDHNWVRNYQYDDSVAPLEELRKRREYLTQTNGWGNVVGCPGCLEGGPVTTATGGGTQ